MGPARSDLSTRTGRIPLGAHQDPLPPKNLRPRTVFPITFHLRAFTRRCQGVSLGPSLCQERAVLQCYGPCPSQANFALGCPRLPRRLALGCSCPPPLLLPPSLPNTAQAKFASDTSGPCHLHEQPRGPRQIHALCRISLISWRQVTIKTKITVISQTLTTMCEQGSDPLPTPEQPPWLSTGPACSSRI